MCLYFCLNYRFCDIFNKIGGFCARLWYSRKPQILSTFRIYSRFTQEVSRNKLHLISVTHLRHFNIKCYPTFKLFIPIPFPPHRQKVVYSMPEGSTIKFGFDAKEYRHCYVTESEGRCCPCRRVRQPRLSGIWVAHHGRPELRKSQGSIGCGWGSHAVASGGPSKLAISLFKVRDRCDGRKSNHSIFEVNGKNIVSLKGAEDSVVEWFFKFAGSLFQIQKYLTNFVWTKHLFLSITYGHWVPMNASIWVISSLREQPHRF